VQHLGTRLGCPPVGFAQGVYLKRYLGSRRRRFRCVEREVHERTVGPRSCSMATAGPAIISAVIGNVKVESEALAVRGQRTIEVRHLKDDSNEAVLLPWHERMMPGLEPRCSSARRRSSRHPHCDPTCDDRSPLRKARQFQPRRHCTASDRAHPRPARKPSPSGLGCHAFEDIAAPGGREFRAARRHRIGRRLSKTPRPVRRRGMHEPLVGRLARGYVTGPDAVRWELTPLRRLNVT
jgi:hypothetical protein